MDANINIRPSLSFSISTNSIALTLNPSSNTFGSQTINLAVGTNNINGYKLYMSSTTGGTNLVNSEDNTKYIETLDTSESGYTESSFTANKWGYKKNNGNYFPFVSGDLISSSNGPVNNDATSITFGAKVDYLAKAGTYELGFNFKVLPITTTTYMQNLSSNVCTADPTIVIDARDEKAYTITRLADGKCWMTSNLRYVGDTGSTSSSMIMKAATSNISADQNLTIGDLTSGNSYDEARIHVATSDQVPSGASFSAVDMGVWYNYAAASAGTITGDSNTNAQVYDVCPKGWRLPTKAEFDGITSYKDAFSLITGGNYLNGNPVDTTTATWWSATPYAGNDVAFRYMLFNFSGILEVGANYCNVGRYVRCVLAEEPSNISEITTMQQFGSLSNAAKTSVASSMTAGQSYPLTDTRDETTYYIAKLADNKVWMVQNLKLGKNTTSVALTSDTSDVPSGGFTLNNKLSNGVFPYTTINDTTDVYDGQAYYCTNDYGCYYNWYTATAGAGVRDVITDGENVDYSICPAGWTLPTQPEWTALNTAYNGTATSLLVSPTSLTENANGANTPGLLLGGSYYVGALSVGSYGFYQSRTAKSDQTGYGMNLDASYVYPASTYPKYFGLAIRCLLK